MIAGVLLLIYVGTQYGTMYLEQHRLAQQFEQQEKAALASQQLHPAVIDPNAPVRLVIPKIDLTSFIIEGTNHHALLRGPGHLKDTVEPGETGNAVISGHRDTFFRHIHELEKGDRVYVDRGGRRFVYEVTGKKIVGPDDISVIKPTSDSQLTLITCYPTYYIGPAPQRLVVFTKLSGDQETALTDTAKDSVKPASESQPTR